MDNVLPFIPVALLVLACPLMMGAMGVGAWLIARGRGEKKELSVGCMGGHGEHRQPGTEAEETKLKEQVAHLEQEVQTLSSQLHAAGNQAPGGDGRAPAKPWEQADAVAAPAEEKQGP